MKTKDVLNIKFKSDDLGKTLTIRDYLYTLLMTLWEQGEGFSGKRPFGNSGWEHDLYKALISGGAIKGSLDEDGYVETYDVSEANTAIKKCIKHMCKDAS